MSKTATLVRALNGFTGSAALYKLSEPLHYLDWDEDGNEVEMAALYVVISAANVIFSGPETYIFPSNRKGEVVSWGELPGSYRGGLDHHEALRGAGYEAA